MENCFTEEKYGNIRLTIRKVILPLVHAIYDEDPADVIYFCYNYFDRLITRREHNAGDLNSKPGRENLNKAEETEIAMNDKEIVEVKDHSPSNVQGSASEPLLTSDKHSEGLGVRETSSWDKNPASNNVCSARLRAFLNCNIADATCRIGDQPNLALKEADGPENGVKAGDADISKKNEEKELEIGSRAENEAPSHEIKIKEVEYPHAVPSAPPLELEAIQDVKSDGFPESQKSSGNEFSSISNRSCVSREKNKTPNKQLSPNSSFGFIPHLDGYSTQEELKNSNPEFNENLSNEIESINETNEGKLMEQITKRLSMTLQSLAQEFTSAETNFNEKFQEAKEITDVLKGQCDTKEIISRLTQDSDYDSENNDGDKASENANFDEKSLLQVRNQNNMKDALKYSPKSPDLENGDDNKHVHFEEESCSNMNGTIHESTKPDCSDVQYSMTQDTDEGNDDSSTLQDDRESDSKSDNEECNQTVDESWRKRWYEAHPHLDNMSDLHQRGPRFFRGHSLFNNTRHNESRSNIGEAGDASGDRFYTAEEAMNENFERSSPTIGLNNFYSSFPVGIHHGVSTGRIDRNLSERKPTSNVPSQSIPYSWRQMCKPQTCSSGNEERFKQKSQMNANKATLLENETQDFSPTIQRARESEVLSEVVIVKEVKGKSEAESSNESFDTQSEITIKTEEEIDEQYENYEENKSKKSEHFKDGEDELIPRKKDEPVKVDNEISFENRFLRQEASSHDYPAVGNIDESLKLQQTYKNNCIKDEVGMAAASFATNKEVNETRRNESLEKRAEPGLNAAGGDVPPSVIIGNDNDSSAIGISEENDAGIDDQNSPTTGIEAAQYFEESSRSYFQQQDEISDESYGECLCFSNDDSDDRSSEYSETDEFSLGSKVKRFI